MKKTYRVSLLALIALLAALLALCPLCALADSAAHAEIIRSGESQLILFTDEDGETYLLLIEDGEVEVIGHTYGSSSNSSSGTQTAPKPQSPSSSSGAICWRCGESLAYGNHTAGECGYKYHSACTDANFSHPERHILCPICDSCFLSSGSRHGIAYGACGAELLGQYCATCYRHYEDDAMYDNYCWDCNAMHIFCPICEKPLTNGEIHGNNQCNKRR